MTEHPAPRRRPVAADGRIRRAAGADVGPEHLPPDPDVPVTAPPVPHAPPLCHAPPPCPAPAYDGATRTERIDLAGPAADQLADDADALSDRALLDALQGLLATGARLTAAATHLVRRAVERSSAEAVESMPLPHWLRTVAGQSGGDARMLTLAADVLATMPATAARFRSGALGWGVVRIVVDEARRLPAAARTELDGALADAVDGDPTMTPDDLVHAIRRLLVELTPERADRDAESAPRRSFVQLTPRLDGGGAMYADLVDPVQFATVASAVETAAARSAPDRDDTCDGPDGSPADGLDRTDGEMEAWRRRRELGRRRATGLVDMASSYLAGGAHGPARPSVLVVASATRTAGPGDGARDTADDAGATAPSVADTDGRRHVVDGPALLLRPTTDPVVPLAPSITRRLLADAQVETVAADPDRPDLPAPPPPSAARFVRGRLRRLLEVRDGGCRMPGCRLPAAFCDAHHVNGDERDTRLTNLVLLCRRHHNWVTRGAWTLHLDGNGTVSASNGRRTLRSLPVLRRRLRLPRDPP